MICMWLCSSVFRTDKPYSDMVSVDSLCQAAHFSHFFTLSCIISFSFIVTCPTVDDVDNGDVLIASDGLSTSVLFTCHNNYMLKGSGSLICRSDGSWNDSVPSCGM